MPVYICASDINIGLRDGTPDINMPNPIFTYIHIHISVNISSKKYKQILTCKAADGGRAMGGRDSRVGGRVLR